MQIIINNVRDYYIEETYYFDADVIVYNTKEPSYNTFYKLKPVYTKIKNHTEHNFFIEYCKKWYIHFEEIHPELTSFDKFISMLNEQHFYKFHNMTFTEGETWNLWYRCPDSKEDYLKDTIKSIYDNKNFNILKGAPEVIREWFPQNILNDVDNGVFDF